MQNVVRSLRLQIGHSRRIDCPHCGGKNTFSVTRTSTQYLWHCFRASCKVSGHEQFLPDASTLAGRLRDWRSTTESKSFCGHKDVCIQFWKMPEWFTSVFSCGRATDFCERWGIISALEAGIVSPYYDPKLERVVLTCLRQGVGQPIDAVGRALRKGVRPKWYRYGASRECFMILPEAQASGNLAEEVLQKHKQVVLVEDCLSAIRVALSGLQAMALLGTHLTQEAKIALAGKSVIIALDADASQLSLKLQRSLAFLSKQVSVCLLRDDLKYVRSKEQVLEILRPGETKTQS